LRTLFASYYQKISVRRLWDGRQEAKGEKGRSHPRLGERSERRKGRERRVQDKETHEQKDRKEGREGEREGGREGGREGVREERTD